jgi:hypothetical protein
MAVLSALAVVPAGCGGSGSKSATSSSTAVTSAPTTTAPPTTLPPGLPAGVTAVIHVDGGPAGVFSADGVLYVTTHRAGAVVSIDPESNTVTRTVRLGDQVGSFAPPTTGSFLWVCTNSDSTVHQVDLKQGKKTASIPAGCDGGSLNVVGTELWVVPGPDASDIVRIDPTTAAVLGRVSLSGQAAPGAFWGLPVKTAAGVIIGSGTGTNTLTLNADGTGIKKVAMATPYLTVVKGTLYSISTDGQLSERNPETLAVVHTYQVPKPEDDDVSLTGDDSGRLYYRSSSTTVSRIDTKTGTVAPFLTTPHADANTGIAFEFGSLWITNYAANTVWRVPVRAG